MNTNAGSVSSPSALTTDAVVVDEHEELLDERAEERPDVVFRGGDEEVDAGVGAAQALEDPRRRRQDPRRLVGVRVEGDRRQVERGQPLGQRPRLAAERGEHQVGGWVLGHEVRR